MSSNGFHLLEIHISSFVTSSLVLVVFLAVCGMAYAWIRWKRAQARKKRAHREELQRGLQQLPTSPPLQQQLQMQQQLTHASLLPPQQFALLPRAARDYADANPAAQQQMLRELNRLMDERISRHQHLGQSSPPLSRTRYAKYHAEREREPEGVIPASHAGRTSAQGGAHGSA